MPLIVVYVWISATAALALSRHYENTGWLQDDDHFRRIAAIIQLVYAHCRRAC